MFLNDRLLTGPSLDCNCCVFSFLLCGMQLQVSLSLCQLYRPIHARLLLDFNKVSVSVSVYLQTGALTCIQRSRVVMSLSCGVQLVPTEH